MDFKDFVRNCHHWIDQGVPKLALTIEITPNGIINALTLLMVLILRPYHVMREFGYDLFDKPLPNKFGFLMLKSDHDYPAIARRRAHELVGLTDPELSDNEIFTMPTPLKQVAGQREGVFMLQLNRIGLIKSIRKRYDLSLMEAKLSVDHMIDELAAWTQQSKFKMTRGFVRLVNAHIELDVLFSPPPGFNGDRGHGNRTVAAISCYAAAEWYFEKVLPPEEQELFRNKEHFSYSSEVKYCPADWYDIDGNLMSEETVLNE